MIPVNLYVDRMSPVPPVRVADVSTLTNERDAQYREAARKIGLTPKEYAEFRIDISEGNADYVVLPRKIDAMAGIHRRSHQVYALRNVLVPAGEMGWRVELSDGTTVLIPRVCGNLSMNRSRAVAHNHRQVPGRAHVAKLAPPIPVRFAADPATPIAVTVPQVADAPASVAPAATDYPADVARGRSILPYFAPLVPLIYHLISTPNTVAPCSQGSNVMGVCR